MDQNDYVLIAAFVAIVILLVWSVYWKAMYDGQVKATDMIIKDILSGKIKVPQNNAEPKG